MNDKNKKIGFAIFYAVLFIYIVFSLNNSSKANDTNTTKKNNEKKEIVEVRNHSFKHIINKDIELSGKVYGSKILTKKIQNSIETNYYQNGVNTYIKEGDKYIKYNDKILNDFDFNLINLSYLDSIVEEAVVKSKTASSIEMYVQNPNMTIEFIYDMNSNLDKTIIKKNNTTVESKYYDVNKIKDFNILTK